MSRVTFDEAERTVDEFLGLLRDCGIELPSGSQTEGDALAMTQVLEIWRGRGERPADPRPVLQAAVGFVDLAGKILSVRNKPGFHELVPHLKKVAEGSTLQNRPSQVTDTVANKLVELYVGALAMKIGTEVKLDDPDHSKGDNPDVMFDFNHRRWAIAVKTPASARNPQTLFDNIKKGSDQIEACDAQHGIVLISLKNVIDHDAFWKPGQDPLPEADAKVLFLSETKKIIDSLSVTVRSDWVEALGPNRKAELPVVFLAQGTFFAQPEFYPVPHPMPLKHFAICLEPADDPVGAMKLVKALHHEMQSLI